MEVILQRLTRAAVVQRSALRLSPAAFHSTIRQNHTATKGNSTNHLNDLSDANIVTAFNKTVSLGQKATFTKTFSAAQVKQFAELSGDSNPLHIDESYAKTTRFGRCIVHGVLMNGVISGLMGAELPGPGSIYLSQEINFRAPLYVGEPVTAEVVVKHIDGKRNIVTFDTSCLDKDGKKLMFGVAKVMLEKQR